VEPDAVVDSSIKHEPLKTLLAIGKAGQAKPEEPNSGSESQVLSIAGGESDMREIKRDESEGDSIAEMGESATEQKEAHPRPKGKGVSHRRI